MVDFINKLIKFPKINLVVRPTLCLYKTENSQILLCEEIKNKSKFCLKIILAQIDNNYQLSSINTEITLLQKLKNEENIVKLIDYNSYTQNNYVFFLLLMEYCQYQTLFDMINQNCNNKNILSDSLIYSYIFQIASGIRAIHNAHFCHMDIRPENILFKDKEKLVICDFGSATNEYYLNSPNNIGNNILKNNVISNNILFSISSKSRLFYRAPEEFRIYSEYPLSEKVDIYCLGIILIMMILSTIPSCNDKYAHFLIFTSKKIRFQIYKEIKTLCNPCFSELIENILQHDPNKRYNIDEVITFLIANEDKILQGEAKYINEKFYFCEYLNKMIYEFEKQEMNKNIINISLLCRKLLESNSIKNDMVDDVPNNSYIDMIINKVNQENRKIIRFYKIIFNSNTFFYNVYSIKAAYILHYFLYNYNNNKIDSISSNIFINKIDTITPNDFKIEIVLQNLINFLGVKIRNNYYDKSETIKNIQISKFNLLYFQFIRNKIIILKKYSLLISNDNTINVGNSSEILSFNFVSDIFNLFISAYQLLFSLPFNTNLLTQILDLISTLLNQEIVSLCSILLTQIIALMKMSKQPKFLEQFIEITNKIAYYFQKLKSFRKQINSNHEIIYFINSPNPDKKLKDLLNYIRNIKFDERFNINEYFNPNSNIRKQMSYIPVKIQCYIPEVYKNYFPELNNNDNTVQTNLKNNINNKQDYQEKEKIIFENNKKLNNSINYNLTNEMKNIKINNNTNNKKNINSNNKSNLKNSKNNYIITNNKNISNNCNKNIDSNNKDLNSSNNNSKISSNSNNNDEYKDFNKCFFENNKECNEDDNISENKNENIVSEISSNLNLFSYLNSNINNNKELEIISNKENDENIISNLQQLVNQPTRAISNYPGDTNAFSNNNSNIKNENLNSQQKVDNKLNNIHINNLINNYKDNNSNNINKPEESIGKPYIMEEILSFLKMEFSKPIYQFLIQQNSIKTYNLIGRGGTSNVYFGNYRGTDVAIKKIKVKEINDNYFKEYKNEIVSLTMVRHPNLIIFMGTMLEDNNLCIVTEYCKGGTLFDLLHKKRNIDLPWNFRLRILIDISKGMNFLHTNNPQIIHSDLKSLNILMTDEIKENSENNNVTIKINDFGLSKIIDKDKIIWESPQGIVGSVQWMAPEVLQNNCTDNTKVDIYSFGIIIWEICTRVQPYKDMSIYQIINYVCNENGRPDINLLPLDQMPKGLLELMENCWNTDPNLRPDFSSALLTLNDMLSLDG